MIRRRKPSPPPDADLADLLDTMLSLAGAAGAYRKALVQQGFNEQLAMMLAGQWLADMQRTGRRG